MALLETLVGGTVGAGLDFGSTWYANRQAEKRQHESQTFDQQMFATRYQTQVKDLQAAGLNPMLAYGQSPGAGVHTTAAPVQKPNLAGAYNETRIASANEAFIRQNTLKAEAEKNLVDVQTLSAMEMPEFIRSQVIANKSSAEQSRAMVEQIRATIPKIETEIDKMETEIAKDKSNIKLNESLIRANHVLNGLRLAEQYLTGEKIKTERLNQRIMDPKAKAAGGVTAELGHVADNIGKIGSAAWKFIFPTIAPAP